MCLLICTFLGVDLILNYFKKYRESYDYISNVQQYPTENFEMFVVIDYSGISLLLC